MDINLPGLFKERMRRMLNDEFDEFIRSYDDDSVHGLRFNPLKYDGREIKDFSLEQVPWCGSGFYYKDGDRPGRHPYHEAGVYYIQEPSAMLTGELVDALPGERVLDLCAAPGGKTTHIAGQMQGMGLLWSNEIHPQRAKILSQNVERLGITNCVVSNETADRLAQRLPGFFDRVVVDAPCSGEGMFRKNPDACGEWSPENVQLCAARQQEILDEADRMLKAGGRLVYSTCTFAPEENEQTIENFLEKHPDYIIESVEIKAADKKAADKYGMPPGGRPEWSESGMPELKNTFRLWPHKLKGEGHFAAVLKKGGMLCKPAGLEADAFVPAGIKKFSDSAGLSKGRKAGKGIAKTLKNNVSVKQAAVLFEKFMDKKLSLADRYLLFGENLYIVPDGMPDIDGLKILRPGLHVGMIKKDRFEPSHALALALKPRDFENFVDMPADDERVSAFLRGESFEAEGLKGWVLVCTDGYSLGWGKASAGIIKNHYPKGLRRI